MSEVSDDGAILIHGARQNNLKNLTLQIPLNRLVVVSGLPRLRTCAGSVFYQSVFSPASRYAGEAPSLVTRTNCRWIACQTSIRSKGSRCGARGSL